MAYDRIPIFDAAKDTPHLTAASPGTGEVLTFDGTTWVPAPTGGAPTAADYLVGTTQAGLSAEIVVGTTPGGELGGTWASPTVDASHSGSTHASLVTSATVEAVGRWEPVQFDDGSSPWPFVYFGDEIVVAFIPT